MIIFSHVVLIQMKEKKKMNKKNIDVLFHPSIVNNIISFMKFSVEEKCFIKSVSNFLLSTKLSSKYFSLPDQKNYFYSIKDIYDKSFLECLFEKSISYPNNKYAKNIFNYLLDVIDIHKIKLPLAEIACKYKNNEALKVFVEKKVTLSKKELSLAFSLDNYEAMKILLKDTTTKFIIEDYNNVLTKCIEIWTPDLGVECITNKLIITSDWHESGFDCIQLYFIQIIKLVASPSVNICLSKAIAKKLLDIDEELSDSMEYGLMPFILFILSCLENNILLVEFIIANSSENHIDLVYDMNYKIAEGIIYDDELKYQEYISDNKLDITDFFIKKNYLELLKLFMNDKMKIGLDIFISKARLAMKLKNVEVIKILAKNTSIQNLAKSKYMIESNFKQESIFDISVEAFQSENHEILEVLASENLLAPKLKRSSIFFETKNPNIMNVLLKNCDITTYEQFYYIFSLSCKSKSFSTVSTLLKTKFVTNMVRNKDYNELEILSILYEVTDEKIIALVTQIFCET